MEKENMPVIDFSEYPGPDTESFIWMPEEDFEQYEVFCEYIQLATSVPEGTNIESGFYCRMEMDDGELCDGTIEVTEIAEPRQIRWRCDDCSDMGAITNYEDSPWDNSLLSEKEKEMFLESFFSDIEGNDLFEDEFLDFYEEENTGPFTDFEYYLNPYDPDGKQTGGPASAQIEELIRCDWLDPESPVYLSADLPLSELEKSYFFYNARQFLLILQKDEAFRLTRNSNLKRKVVKLLLDNTRWPDNYVDNIIHYRKLPDETDVWLLHGVRVLLELAGIIERDENVLVINDNYSHLLEEENAGQLYRMLFSVYFKEMNLGYLGSTFELPHLQYSIPFILYKLKELAKKWTPLEDLTPDILLFTVSLELNYEDVDSVSMASDLLYEDLFSALSRFGLLETRKSSAADRGAYPDQVRITPLMESFLVFNV
jgi:hypothetical protein